MASLSSLLPRDTTTDFLISQARSVAEILDAFIHSLEELEASLGINHRKGFRHAGGSKARWAVFVSKTVKELQAKITLPLATIYIDIGLHLM